MSVGFGKCLPKPCNSNEKTAILFSAALLASVSMPLTARNTSASGSKSETETVMVGGEAMYPQKNIVENAVSSKDHTTLAANVTITDVSQSNGVIHVIDRVVLPQ